MIKIVVAGAGGRMGTRIIELSKQDSAMKVVYGLESPGKAVAGGVPSGADLSALDGADVVIDFTVAAATSALAPEVAKRGKAYVIGTTGFSPEQDQALTLLAKQIPIMKSSNMSLGVNVFFKAAKDIGALLPDYTVHIEETHHIHKKDAPSGTALQAGRGIETVSNQKVTYKSLREGEVIGDHRVVFQGPSDRIELFHHADSRDLFATGALHAAKWVAGKKPGLYTMQDVLGL